MLGGASVPATLSQPSPQTQKQRIWETGPRSHSTARPQLQERVEPSSALFPTGSKIYTTRLDAFPEAWVLSKGKVLVAKTLGPSGEDRVDNVAVESIM